MAQRVQRKGARRTIGFRDSRRFVLKTSRRIQMATLDVREKARRIVELFRSRQPIEILPAELYPANLGEAYAIRRAFQEIEETEGRGAIAGYKIGLTTPVMQKLCGVGEPCYGAIFAQEVHHRRAELAAADYCRL